MPSLTPPLDRRELLRLIAAGAAATVAGCSAPDETIFPYVDQPEGVLPGVLRRYATTLPFAGYGRGVTGLVVDSRPIKLEGLAAHPASLGATDLFIETAILDLYDPQRLRAVAGPEGPASWAGLARAIHDRGAGRGGGGLAILTGRVTSPTLLARIAALKAAYPDAHHVAWEPFDDDDALMWFGRGLSARPRFRDADVILTLGADPLGPGPDQIANAKAWSDRRRHAPTNRLYAVEPSLTITGAMADVRASAGPTEMAELCRALAAALGGEAPDPQLPPRLARLVTAAARDLSQASGRALILPGRDQPADVQAFAAWANRRLDAPIDWITPVDLQPFHRQPFAELVDAMHRGAYDTLVIIDSNPVYAAPPELRFGAAMAKVPLTVVASNFPNETAARATWTAPLSHPLEGWHDWRGPDGTASIAQPLVRPFYDSRTASEIVDLIASPIEGPGSRARVRETWAALAEPAWREAVLTGVVPGTAAALRNADWHTAVGAAGLQFSPVTERGEFHLEIRPSPNLWDGRHASNAWAQECPDSLTKEVWGSSARLHPLDMGQLGLLDGDLLRIARGAAAVTIAARADAGQARGVVTLLAGYGRSESGAVADGIGANALALAGNGPLTISRADGHAPIVTTQHQFRLEGELERLFPVLGPSQRIVPPPPRPTLVPPNPPARDNAPPQWAMAIDTDVCIGCNACVVACQAENNVPVIGPGEMAIGRDMHWLRVDRYDHHGTVGFQPVPCMQCEKAPCEPVCPVEASVHDAQGLNVQVYNRCIGTRNCQANCPYKVRRFNFRDYAGSSVWGDVEDASITAQRNPDVTVRARGVMEKCTYCVQRISAATREADGGGDPPKVVTACAAACPTDAITFGTIDGAEIAAARASPRHYALLEELGTRPRTTYLARRKNIPL